MRNLRKNTQVVWYARYEGKSEIKRDGKPTGQDELAYGKPVAVRISVGPDKGVVTTELFGLDCPYSRVMTSASDLDINEMSKVWVDKVPDDGDADYYVSRVSKGLNQHSWALTRVSKDEG